MFQLEMECTWVEFCGEKVYEREESDKDVF